MLESRKAAAASVSTLGMCLIHHHTYETMAWSELDTLIAVILSLQRAGDDPWAPGYDELVRAMLGEAELHMQQGRRSGPWLTAMAPLYPVRCLPPASLARRCRSPGHALP